MTAQKKWGSYDVATLSQAQKAKFLARTNLVEVKNIYLQLVDYQIIRSLIYPPSYQILVPNIS
ncbi:MAG: hypothetical protein EAY79_04490 [Runella slithyformis]|nr:MAG: hypothetical protein EAY79_04490 [Runella slithyformis]TAF02549.1 MAG: hypothetical protein EAZ80_00950 [Runella slithyformis]TAF49762.1 MAG: hypothetical protein EAZ63_00510 [Runella slithyformis]TAG53930.1 MAG: hypothetical protein EAZ29_05100 [Runella slithyformis]